MTCHVTPGFSRWMGRGEGEDPSALSHLPTTGPGAQQFELQPEGQGGEGTTIWLPPQVTPSF